MFYSHELLTNRRYGVATIWLVATLGSKSTLKKVTRKAILDVDIPKACDTITDPDTPLALRLQASLLYGVSRVHFQQCNYVLTDTQSFRDKMRGIAQVMKELEIDPDVGRTRTEQLNLPDDPGFLPDLDFTFDLTAFDLPSDSSSSRASSVLSSRCAPSSQTTGVEIEEDEANPQLNLPSLDTPSAFGGMSVGVRTSAGIESVVHQAPGSHYEESPFIDDAEFEIAPDGSLVAVERPPSQPRHSGVASVVGEGRPVSESNFSTRVRDEHEAGAAADDQGYQHIDDNGFGLMGDEYDVQLPLPEPEQGGDQAGAQQTEDPNAQDSPYKYRPQSVSTETVSAPERRARPGKHIQIDQRTELQNKDLGDWSTNYLDNMAQSTKTKQGRSVIQGKKNAAFWVLGQGIGGVEANFGDDREPHPLAIFSGQSLLDALVGSAEQRSPSSSKRTRSSSPTDQDGRRVRARTDDGQDAGGGAPEVANTMGYDEEGILGQGNEYQPESEVGRRAGSSLPDMASSLPWNRSASRQESAQPLFGAGFGISSSVGGPGSGMRLGPGNVLSRFPSRMASSSPLVGKGRQYADLDNLMDLAGQGAVGEDEVILNVDDFEQYGPAAAVDTQTANQSQWMRTTLESEAQNFLGFIEAQIVVRREEGQNDGSVTLDQLLPPGENSGVVAAQALLHVLALTTKGLLEVEQEEAFGDIVLKTVARVSAMMGSGGEEPGRGGDHDRDQGAQPAREIDEDGPDDEIEEAEEL